MNKQQIPSGALGVLATVRFLAELGMLTALGYVGYRLGGGSIAPAVVLAALLPLGAVMAWGRWVAPKARHRLLDPSRLAVEVTLFGAAFLGLAKVGPSPDAIVWGVVLWAAFLVSAPVGRKEF